MEFFADGTVRLDSAELLDWKLVGHELSISHPGGSPNPIRVRLSFPDDDHLEFAVLDSATGKPASRRRFQRVPEEP